VDDSWPDGVKDVRLWLSSHTGGRALPTKDIRMITNSGIQRIAFKRKPEDPDRRRVTRCFQTTAVTL
jgi:hypothetical protein